jgi:hypothetical protein
MLRRKQREGLRPGFAEATRERLAWFCLSRAHLKDIGREIAGTCFKPSGSTVFPGGSDEGVFAS